MAPANRASTVAEQSGRVARQRHANHPRHRRQAAACDARAEARLPTERSQRHAFDAKLNLRQKNEGRYSGKVKASTRPRKFRLIRAWAASGFGGIVNRRFLFFVLFVCAAGAATLVYVFQRRVATAAEFDHQLKLAKDEAGRLREQIIRPTEKKVPAGGKFTAALQKFGLSASEAANAAAAAQHDFDLRQVRAGNTITVGRSVEGTLREIDYKIDSDRMLKIVPEDSAF